MCIAINVYYIYIYIYIILSVYSPFPIGLEILIITFTSFSISFYHGHLLCRSQVRPYPLLLSNHVFLSLPNGLLPSTLYSIHFFTQSSSHFLITCPYHLSLPLLMKVMINRCADFDTTPHDVKHLFVCPAHPTTLIPSDLWSRSTDAVRELSYLEAKRPRLK